MLIHWQYPLVLLIHKEDVRAQWKPLKDFFYLKGALLLSYLLPPGKDYISGCVAAHVSRYGSPLLVDIINVQCLPKDAPIDNP